MKCWVLKQDAYGSVEKNEIDYEGTIINGFQSHGGAVVLVAKDDGNLATPEAKFVKTKNPENKELKDGQVIGNEQPDVGAGTPSPASVNRETGSNDSGNGQSVGEVRQCEERIAGATESVRETGSGRDSNSSDNRKKSLFRRGNR